MTDTSSLSHLIERLERATGPDRETDLAIQLAIEPDGDIAGLMQFRRGFDGKPGMAWDIHHGGSVCFEKRDDGGRCFYNGGYPLPKYSSSIDAAMTLLPDGVYWMAAYGKRSVNEPLGACALYHPGVDNPFVQVEGRTVAIAFCITALKAQLSTRTNEQDDARNLSGVSSE